MPELPEVEALRRGLVTRIVGSKILKVEVRQEKLVAGKGTTRKPNKTKTKNFIEGLEGKKILGIERRAKNLMFDLGKGSMMLVHLKMTGQLVFVPKATPSPLRGASQGKHKLEIFPYNPKLIKVASENRKKMTLSEVLFWNIVKGDKTDFDFTRQKVIGNFILDFYSNELKLGVEIDGSAHDNTLERDIERTNFLENYGIKVLRFQNNEVKELTVEKLKEIFSKRKLELEDPSLWEGGQGPEGVVLGGHPIEESETKLPHKHTYIIFTLNNGTLYYNDVRQFGYVLYYPDKSKLEEENHFENIGLEPFDKSFTLKYFRESLKNKTTPIKKLLLDQTVVVGCGNIYCDEVCFASSVLPMRPSRSLNEAETKSLYENIKKILDKAINSGGSSVANYLLADGKRGNYADYHNVYQKDGTRCKFKSKGKRCSGTIEKITFAGRGTHFCPVHQH